LHRGAIYAELGKVQKAFNDLNRAIELNPKFAEAYYVRGYVYFSIIKNEEGIKDYQAAARLGLKPAQDFLKAKEIQW